MPFAFGRKPVRRSAVLLLLLLPAHAVTAQIVPRRVLALYKSSEDRSAEINEIAGRMQLVLNNLGLVVEYLDAEGALPPPEKLPEYRGFVAYFVSGDMRHAARFRRWVSRWLTSGKKAVFFNNFGAYSELGAKMRAQDARSVKKLFQQMGLEPPLNPVWIDGLKIQKKAAAYFDFERALNPAEVPLTGMRSVSTKNRVLLQLARGNQVNDAAVLGPWGGFVQTGVDFWLDEQSGRGQWMLNPFRFFREALALADLPIADINTLGGRRTAFCHIDGDGFGTISKIDRWHSCADLMRIRVFERFDLPFSVSVITAVVDTAALGSPQALETARRIFSLPNVEPASHGFAHPFDWRSGRVAFDSIPGYHFDPEREIVGSMHFIQQHLLPPERNIRLFFWTGMGNPTPEQIHLVEDNRWLQLNGRAGFLDSRWPSISDFAPPYDQVRDVYRNNARISNEYEFTNHWQPPYEKYADILRTFAFTEKYGPLVPANLYLHFYIMEWPESWQALKRVLRYMTQQNWSFVYASDYVRMVEDFRRLKIRHPAPEAWEVRNAGALRTLRFSETEKTPDLRRSRGVVGFSRRNKMLFVHLDGSLQHRIVLSDRAVYPRPYLDRFNMLVDSLRTAAEEIRLFVRGFGEFVAQMEGLQPGMAYQIVAESTAAEVDDRPRRPQIKVVKSTGSGELAIRVRVYNRDRICIRPATGTAYWKYRLRLPALLGLGLLAFVWMRYQMRTAWSGRLFRRGEASSRGMKK